MKYDVVGPAKVTKIEADKYRIVDGHLYLQVNEAQRGAVREVAVFTPGAWHSVVESEDQE